LSTKKKPKKLAPPDNAFVQTMLQGWWKEASDQGTTEKTDPERMQFLRPSSLPFCSLRTAYTRIYEGVDDERHMSFNENFYVNQGSAIHQLLQDFVGRMKIEGVVDTPVETLGHWKCPRCGHKRRFTTYKRCTKCRGRSTYEEIEIRWRNTVGHIDKVIRIGNMLFILDYKTTGTKALIKHRMQMASGEAPLFPYVKNRAQILSYVGLFERVFKKLFKKGGPFYKCTVVGGILAYISREDVFRREFVYLPADAKTKARLLKQSIKDDKVFGRMLKVVEKPSMKGLKEMIEHKACSSREDYVKNMEDKWDPCPLAKVCFQRKKLLEELKGIL